MQTDVCRGWGGGGARVIAVQCWDEYCKRGVGDRVEVKWGVKFRLGRSSYLASVHSIMLSRVSYHA